MIITSLLDTDLYKLTMMQAVFHQFSDARVEYRFSCRTPAIDFTPAVPDITPEIDHLCTLGFSSSELDYLGSLPYMKNDFLDYLKSFRLPRTALNLKVRNGELDLSITGSWLDTILFEVPVLAVINECYFKTLYPDPDWDTGRRKLQAKIEQIRQTDAANLGLSVVDFGTRRRFSKSWQEEVLSTLKQSIPARFTGTSNVDLARRLGLRPVGTMAHEWLMAAQVLAPVLRSSQAFALDRWVDEYRGDLGIALSDTVGFTAFLNDFDMYFAKLYDGCRHDSGDPFSWGDRLIAHYRRLGIDPCCKRAVFSDGLTVERIIDLARYFKGRIGTAYGIGTNLTNDVSGTAIQIVIKMTRCQGLPVAKLSDSPGKQMCTDKAYLDHLSNVFKGDHS
ncbi:nicotinate phosphoribosyltransferase [Desulfatiferula olefinivorans]